MKSIYLGTTTFFLLLSCLVSTADAQGLATIQVDNLKAESRNGNVGLSWKSAYEQNLMQYEVEYSADGRYYKNLGFIPARNHSSGDFYEFENPVTYSDSAFYRLKIVDNNGGWLYTKPVLYKVNNTTAFFVYPSVVTSSVLNIFIKDPFYSVEVVSLNGAVMLKQNLSGKTGRINIPISSNLSAGMYVVQLKNYDKTITQKIMIE